MDVCDKDALKAAVKDITAKYGAPTIVVNNAGLFVWEGQERCRAEGDLAGQRCDWRVARW